MSNYQGAFSEFVAAVGHSQTSESSAEAVSPSPAVSIAEMEDSCSLSMSTGIPAISEIPEDLSLPKPNSVTTDAPQIHAVIDDVPVSESSTPTPADDKLSQPESGLDLSSTREVPSLEMGLSQGGDSVGSKLDKITKKLMSGLSKSSSSEFTTETPELKEPSTSNIHLQDEEAVQGEDMIMDSQDRYLAPERPFSDLQPPSNENSQPEFVEELVSDNLPLDFSEALDGNSEICSQNGGSVPMTPCHEDSVSVDPPEADDDDVPKMDDEESRLDLPDEVSDALSEAKSQPEPSEVKDGQHVVTAEFVCEYQWPPEMGGDIFMIQEQVSVFLGVLSFKRKYQDLARRPVEYKERIFLMDRGYVTEVQCDLGLTALRSEEVYELMARDYPAKYTEYIAALRERERKRISEQNKGYSLQNMEKAKMEYLVKKAVRSAAVFNAQFMQEKREERRAYFDLQTFEVQFPRNKYKPLPPEMTKVDAYPIGLLPGQYQDYYKSYTPQELKYFPMNTALYSPHRALNSIYADPNIVEERDSADEDKDDGSSSSDNSQSGSSDSEPDSIEGEVAKKQISEEQIKKLLATPRPDTPPKKARRKQAQNGAETADSEKDSEPAPTRGRPRKTPGRKTPMRRTTKKNGSSQGNSEKCNICLEMSSEEIVQCFECKKVVHPSCAELTTEMIPIIKTYSWQCMECKSCVKCKDAQDEEKMMFCDLCDRGYHTYCVGLTSIPDGRWECPSCFQEGPTPKKKGKQK